jgi:hypothetical protein
MINMRGIGFVDIKMSYDFEKCWGKGINKYLRVNA